MNAQTDAEKAAAIERLYEKLNVTQTLWDMWHEEGNREGEQIATRKSQEIRLEIAYLKGDLPRPAPRRPRASRR